MSTVDILIQPVESHHDIVVVRIDGPLDTVASYSFQESMDQLLEQGVYKFIVDLEALDYISSAGIGVFPGIAQTLREHQGGIVFINVSAKIKRLFEMIGLTTIFTIHSSVEEALREFVANT